MTTSIGGVQQIRSQSLNQIKKIGCIPTDEEQAQQNAKSVIQEANLEADDYCQLEQLCAERIRIAKIERYRTVYDIDEKLYLRPPTLNNIN